MLAAADLTSCFASHWTRRRAAELGAAAPGRSAEALPAALAFADISGFTPLARRLAEQGPQGAEQLNRILNAFYGALVDLIYEHGGDVLAYAGDAALVFWPANDAPLAEAAARAVQCGLAGQAGLASPGFQQTLRQCGLPADLTLAMRISIAAGQTLAVQAGGVGGYWQTVVTGEPLDQIRAADKHSSLGGVTLSPPAWELVRGAVEGQPLPDGHARAVRMRAPLAVPGAAAPPLSPEAAAALRGFIPPLVLTRCEAGFGDWMSELRRASVLFVRLEGVSARSLEDVPPLQDAAEIIQRVVGRLEGTVVQLLADEKGTAALLCFGLPPLTHEDDALRAVRAAETLRRELAAAGVGTACGIATGRVFCGPRGSPLRREYAVTGESVNLAARLMSQSRGEILCDGATEQATRGKTRFRRLPSFRLKGLAKPTRVFRPAEEGAALRLVGRTAEGEALQEFFAAARRGERRLLTISGEAGSGKTALVQAALEEAGRQAVLVALGAAQAHAASLAYRPWGEALSRVLRIDGLPPGAPRRAALAPWRERIPDAEAGWARLERLLGAEEEDGRPEPPTDQPCAPLHRVVRSLLRLAAGHEPLVLILEDVQWLDRPSWALLNECFPAEPAFSVILTLRSPPDSPSAELLALGASAPTRGLVLERLTRAESAAMAAEVWGIAELAPDLQDHVYEQSGGLPLRVAEVALRLRDAEAIVVEKGVCRLTAPGEAPAPPPTGSVSWDAAASPPTEALPAAAPRRLAGRTREREALREFAAAARAGEQRLLTIEGEAGIGKSALVQEALDEAARQGLPCALGAANAIERHTAYLPWRDVFARLLRLEGLPPGPRRREAVAQACAELPEFEQTAALLNPVLGVDFDDSPLVRQLSDRLRGERLHRLLRAILQGAVRQSRLLLVLEDVQWLDGASWALLLDLFLHVERLAVVLALRPWEDAPPQEFADLLAASPARRLNLDALTREETAELSADVLGVRELAADLRDYLFEHSGGNPFFATELAAYLRDAGLIRAEQGVCRIASAREQLAAAVPSNVQSVVTSRVDQLTLPEQLTLKTASVIGRVFGHGLLRDVLPVAASRPRLPEHLAGLRTRSFIQPHNPAEHSAFRHITIQQTVYEQLTSDQRQGLHADVARWCEARLSDAAAEYPLLAHHWGCAREAAKEIDYLARSGEQALRLNASRDAVDFLERALARHRETWGASTPAAERRRRGHWGRLLGEAYFRLGDLAASRRELERALAEFGVPAPTARGRLACGIVGQAAVQLVRRLLGRQARPAAAPTAHPEEDWRAEAALADQRLAQIHYFTNEVGPGVHRALRSLNRAEPLPGAPGVARSYANLCIVAGLVPLPRLAARYARLAENLARAQGEWPTLAYVLTVCSTYLLGRGEWERVREGAEECIEISARLGDPRLVVEALTVRAMLRCFLSQYEASRDDFARVVEVGAASGNGLHQAWGWSGQGECLFRRGELTAARAACETAQSFLQGRGNRTEDLRVNGLLSLICRRLGAPERSREHADRVWALLRDGSPSTTSCLEGIACALETCLEEWEAHPALPSARPTVREGLRFLRTYTRCYRIGEPRLLRLQGWAAWLDGRSGAAVRCWKRSFRAAARYCLPWEAGAAHLEWARRLPPRDPQRAICLLEARQLFTPLGAAYELDLVRGLESAAAPTSRG